MANELVNLKEIPLKQLNFVLSYRNGNMPTEGGVKVEDKSDFTAAMKLLGLSVNWKKGTWKTQGLVKHECQAYAIINPKDYE